MELVKKNPKIIIISGKARTGKNRVADIIKNIYSQKHKNAINVAYAFYVKEYAKNILGWDGNEETKPRKFLQELGIDLIKNKIDDHMLINRVIEDIKVYSYFYDVITISDARMVEEIETIKEIFDDVIVIHVYNNTISFDKHITETSLDNYNNYDYEIDNSYDLSFLYDRIKEIVDREEL